MKKPKQPDKSPPKSRQSSQTSLDPDEYRRILKGIELQDILLEECAATLDRDKLTHPSRVDVTWKISRKKIIDDHAEILIRYELLSNVGDVPILKITSVFKVIYSSVTPLSKEFINIFAERNCPLNTWPYFREFTQSTAQKMSLPSLVLPLLKFGVDS